jgi:hypothetical protein
MSDRAYATTTAPRRLPHLGVVGALALLVIIDALLGYALYLAARAALDFV